MMYDMEGNTIAPMEKGAAHERMREEYEQGSPTVKDHHIHLVLMNPAGQLLVYKRGQTEEDNRGLIDKLGTHLPYKKDKESSTFENHSSLALATASEVIKRLSKEVIIADYSDLARILEQHRGSINTDTAVIWPEAVYQEMHSIRVVSDGRWVNPNITTRVFGYLPDRLPEGNYSFVAPETIFSGVNRPRVFTDDLREIVRTEAKLVSLDERIKR